MLKDFGCPRIVKLKDSGGTIINPATNEKLEELKSLLQQIENAVDDLEIKADTINLNTDTLEAKVQSVRDQLDVLLSTRASEVTAQAILDAIGQDSGTDILSELQSIVSRLDVDLSTLATEATLQQVEGHLDTVETKLQSIINTLDVNLSTRASEVTLQEIRDSIGQESASTVLSRLKDIWDKLVELFVTGIAKVKIWNGSYIADVTVDNRLKVETYPATGSGVPANEVIIIDDDGNRVTVTPGGRLRVSQEIVTPPGTTPVDEGGQVTVTKQGGTNEYNWVIPNGENVFLTRLEFGAYIPKDVGQYFVQAKCELWYQPNGNTTGQELLVVIYLHSESDKFRDINKNYTGDGTKRIQMKVTSWTVEDIECARFFRGYY